MTVTVEEVIRYAAAKCNGVVIHFTDTAWIEVSSSELSNSGLLHVTLNTHPSIKDNIAWGMFINYFIDRLRDYKENGIKAVAPRDANKNE